MSDVDFTLDGQPDIQRALEGLPDHLRRTSLAEAIAKAGALVAAGIRDRAHFGEYSTGALARSIEFRATQIGGEPSGIVVPNRTKGKGRAVGYHGNFVEYGTQPHMEPWRQGGRPVIPHPGMQPEPFFWPGVDATSEAALDAMESTCGVDVQSAWDGGSAGDAGGSSDGGGDAS